MNINIKISTNQSSVLDKLSLKQTVNKELLQKLISSSLLLKQSNKYNNIFYENEKQQLVALLNQLKKSNTSDVIYKKSKGLKVGRVISNECLGLVSFRKKIRHTIAKDYYIDIDVVNCHPVILLQICKRNNIKTDYLEKYVLNRDHYLNLVIDTYNVSRDQAKNLFIRLLYFGSISTWLSDEKIENKVELDFVKDFKNELNVIGDLIIQANPTLKKIITDNKKKTKNNISDHDIKASTCSIYLQDFENQILETVYNYSIDKGYITDNAVLCYDGLMIPKDNYNEDLLIEFQNIVQLNNGFDVSFTQKELNDGYTIEEINEAQIEDDLTEYEKTKLNFEKTHFKIMYPISYATERNDKLILNSKYEFIDMFQNMKLEETDIKGNQKEISFISKWMDDKNIRTYDSIDFLPCQKAPDNIYNTFNGFEAEKKELYDCNMNDTLLFKHIKNLTNNNELVYKYFLDCLANIIQHPYKKTNTALIMKSIQGCGKDTIFDYFGRQILGSKYYSSQDSIELLFGRFNSEIENKLLVVMNEASGKDTYIINEKIKGAITRATNSIENKGMKAYDNTNNIFYVFLTNNNNAVKVEEHDRRFCAIESSDKYANNEIYFNKLYDELYSGKIDKSFFNFLKERDISKVNFTNDRPKTEFYKNMKSMNIPIIGRYLCEYIDNVNSLKSISSKLLFDSFNYWCCDNKFKNEMTSTSFGLQIKTYDGIIKSRNSIGMKYSFEIDKLKEYLIKKQYYEIDLFVDNEITENKKVIKKNLLNSLDLYNSDDDL